MTLQYIKNPKIITHTTKAIIKELMSSGVPNEWVIVCTSTTKTAFPSTAPSEPYNSRSREQQQQQQQH